MYQKTYTPEKAQTRQEKETPGKGVSLPAVSAVQKAAAEEEEPLQGRFETAQREAMDEELPAQGKFEPVQKVEEEEPLQGRFETAQREAMDEELPAQGKFEPVQKAEEEEPLQGRFETAQREAMDEELPAQGKFHTVQKKKSGTNPVQLEDGGVSARNNDTGMPDQLKSGIEKLSGFAMDDVKVHYNSDKPKQLQAHAYAQGTDIHVAPGQEKHLPHEAWHVAQQKQGRVQPTMQMKQGVPVNDDPGLEKEADEMGAKAIQGKWVQSATAQLRFDKSLLSGSVQRRQTVTAQRNPESATATTTTASSGDAEEAKFQQKYKGIIGMINNAGAILSEVNWAEISAPGMDKLGVGATVTGLVGTATGGAGSITNLAQGKSEDKNNLMGAAGEITAGVGSSIGAVVKAFSAIKRIATSSEKDDMFVEGTEIAKELLEALKSGCEAAASITQFVNGSVPPGFKQLIPGLGLAIAACDIIVNTYSTYNAHIAKTGIASINLSFKEELAALVGADKTSLEKVVPTLFDKESRGKWWASQSYIRLRPGLFESLEHVTERGISPTEKASREEKFRAAHPKIPSNVPVPALIAAIRNYEFGSKMDEINQKRRAQGGMNIFTALLAVGGEIAKFFPADGGITAIVLLGASSGISAANSAAKFISTQTRDRGILGGDKNRSSAQKHKEYVNHTRSLYQYLSAATPATRDNESKVAGSEKLLESTGVNTSAVYKTKYTDANSKKEQVNTIVDAMKSGR